MSNEESLSTQPVSLSFQEFRDEQIVHFFANEHRTFRPDQVGVNFGRCRLVGAPHDLSNRPHPSNQHGVGKKSRAGLREKTQATVPLTSDMQPEVLSVSKVKMATLVEASFSKSARPLGAGQGTVGPGTAGQGVHPTNTAAAERSAPKSNPKPKKPILMKLAFPRPAATPEETLLKQLRETDPQLGRLVEIWPRLSPQIKETILALIEV